MTFTKDDLKRVAWTFVQGFLAGLVAGLASLGGIPSSWDGAKAAAFGLVVGALAAGFSAIKNLLTPTGSALK